MFLEELQRAMYNHVDGSIKNVAMVIGYCALVTFPIVPSLHNRSNKSTKDILYIKLISLKSIHLRK